MKKFVFACVLAVALMSCSSQTEESKSQETTVETTEEATATETTPVEQPAEQPETVKADSIIVL